MHEKRWCFINIMFLNKKSFLNKIKCMAFDEWFLLYENIEKRIISAIFITKLIGMFCKKKRRKKRFLEKWKALHSATLWMYVKEDECMVESVVDWKEVSYHSLVVD